MKILPIILLIVFCLAATGYAEMYVIYDRDTREIHTVAEKDDTVVPVNHEKAVLEGDMKDYKFDEHPSYMKFIDGEFIVDAEKIKEKQDFKAKQQKELLIQKKLRQIAIDALKSEGVM